MSVFQLKTHYLVYRCLRDLYIDKQLSVEVESQRDRMRLYVPASSWIPWLAIEDASASTILAHCINGLRKLDLISEHFAYGSAADLKDHTRLADEAGFFVVPTPVGAELFLWATGHPDAAPSDFNKSSIEIPPSNDLPTFPEVLDR